MFRKFSAPLKKMLSLNQQSFFSEIKFNNACAIPEKRLSQQVIFTNQEPISSKELFNTIPNIKILENKPEPHQLKRLADQQRKATLEFNTQYPFTVSCYFQGKIAYTVLQIPQDEVLSNGGLEAFSETGLWFDPVNGDNSGCVCFSLLPEGAIPHAMNASPKAKVILLAAPLFGNATAVGGPWRQVFYPGAYPIPPTFLGAEIMDIDSQGKVTLGPIFGQKAPGMVLPGERFDDFLNNTIQINPPKDGDRLESGITDTPATLKLQAYIDRYYQYVEREMKAPLMAGQRLGS